MARLRRGPESNGAGDSWQMTYCSVVMILVAIFMMISSYSTIEGKKMSRALNCMGDKKRQGPPGPQKAGTGNPTEDLIESTMAALKKEMGHRGLDESIVLSRTASGFKLTMEGGVFFYSAFPKIREDACPVLDAVASVIRGTPFQVGIAAHSDERSSKKGTSISPWETTAMHAGLILRYLSEKGGLPLRRLASAGFGPYRPGSPGDRPTGTARNDRVDFLFELPVPAVQGFSG